MNGSPPDEVLARLAELEAELTRVKFERDLYKKSIYDSMRGSEFDVSLTLEEQDELMNAPQGESLLSIIEEHESKYSGSP